MEQRKIRLMRELQMEYYGEIRREKRKKSKEAMNHGIWICVLLLGLLVGALLR